jgi:HK97 family phage major capsid protein
MKETTFTNNAAEVAEGGVYGESAIALTETSDEVEKVAVWLPVTDEQLEDVAGLSEYLNNRLTYMLKARIDYQLIRGNGTTPNIWGLSQLSSVQTQAKGNDPVPDAFFKAMTKIRGTSAGTGFAEPSACFIHPNDWQDIRLLRTADGIYIFGNPTDPGPERLWGVNVCVTSVCSENTGVVSDVRGHNAIFFRRGIQFKVTDSHASYFIYGKQAIRADIRLASVSFRDSATCTVTSI